MHEHINKDAKMQTKQIEPNKLAQSKHKETKHVITQRGELIMS